MNGLWEASDPAVHLRVWGTEVLTWELPYLSQGALQTGFPGSFSVGAPPTPSQKSGPWPSSGGRLLGPLHREPGLQEGLQGAAPPQSGLSGRPGPSPSLRGWAGGSPPGPRTKRLSNFLASVMWTQLSFSTTLMCFTSSLNLGQAHRGSGHRAGCAAPPRRAPGLLHACWSKDPGPRSTLLLFAAPSRPSPPAPAWACLRLSVYPSTRPPGLSEAQTPGSAKASGPRAPHPGSPQPHGDIHPGCCLLSALGTSPSLPPPAPTLRLQQHRLQVRGPRGAASPQLCNCLLRLSSSTPSRQEGLFLSHAEHRPSRPSSGCALSPECSTSCPPQDLACVPDLNSNVASKESSYPFPSKHHPAPCQLTPKPKTSRVQKTIHHIP